MISRACTGKPASAATLTRKGFPTNWLTQLHGRRESELSGVVMPSVDDIPAALRPTPVWRSIPRGRAISSALPARSAVPH
jgi:hypothetical protein